MRRRRLPGRAMRVVAAVSAALLFATVGANASIAAPSDFPSWSDLQAAKRDEATAKAELTKLNASISAAQVEVDRTQAEAEARGTEYAEAQQSYDEQVLVTQRIQEQQADAQAEADKAQRDSILLIAGLAKHGAVDVTTELLGDTGGADDYLYRIGAMQRVTERSDAVYTKAAQLENTAKALGDQASVAQNKLDELKQDAESKFQVAQAASETAAKKYAQLQEAQAKAESLVAYLTDKRQVTEADYLEGLKQQWGSGSAGEVSASGWARPAAGAVRSPYGMRTNPVTGRWMLHTGVDLPAGGCGGSIYAAHAGVVTYAGWFGTWGNYIKIDHGDGTDTGYAHIQPGGIGVSVGQTVAPGQLIARTGTTGQSTGCHLHFIVRVNGNTTDPVPFMRNQGITFG